MLGDADLAICGSSLMHEEKAKLDLHSGAMDDGDHGLHNGVKNDDNTSTPPAGSWEHGGAAVDGQPMRGRNVAKRAARKLRTAAAKQHVDGRKVTETVEDAQKRRVSELTASWWVTLNSHSGTQDEFEVVALTALAEIERAKAECLHPPVRS